MTFLSTIRLMWNLTLRAICVRCKKAKVAKLRQTVRSQPKYLNPTLHSLYDLR